MGAISTSPPPVIRMTNALFQPIRFRGLTLENRIMVSPMCQYSAVDGCMTDWHLVHLGMLANSGAALLCFEIAGCDSEVDSPRQTDQNRVAASQGRFSALVSRLQPERGARRDLHAVAAATV